MFSVLVPVLPARGSVSHGLPERTASPRQRNQGTVTDRRQRDSAHAELCLCTQGISRVPPGEAPEPLRSPRVEPCLHRQHQSRAARSANPGCRQSNVRLVRVPQVSSAEEARWLGAVSGPPLSLFPRAQGGEPLTSFPSPPPAHPKRLGEKDVQLLPPSCSPIPHSAPHTSQLRQHQEAPGDGTVTSLS